MFLLTWKDHVDGADQFQTYASSEEAEENIRIASALDSSQVADTENETLEAEAIELSQKFPSVESGAIFSLLRTYGGDSDRVKELLGSVERWKSTH